jgi:hypothetical protein
VKAGDRVAVSIRDRGVYASGSADSLDGRVGVVEEVHANGSLFVAFDDPAPPWWSGQLPVRGFWFPPCDLVSEGGSGRSG